MNSEMLMKEPGESLVEQGRAIYAGDVIYAIGYLVALVVVVWIASILISGFLSVLGFGGYYGGYRPGYYGPYKRSFEEQQRKKREAETTLVTKVSNALDQY